MNIGPLDDSTWEESQMNWEKKKRGVERELGVPYGVPLEYGNRPIAPPSQPMFLSGYQDPIRPPLKIHWKWTAWALGVALGWHGAYFTYGVPCFLSILFMGLTVLLILAIRLDSTPIRIVDNPPPPPDPMINPRTWK
jgi:hypothetical protein